MGPRVQHHGALRRSAWPLHLATALTWQDHTRITATMATHDPELASAAARHGLGVIG